MTLAALARRTMESLPPPLRWRTRNAAALARWLVQRARPASVPSSYDGEFWALHDGGDWDGFARVIARLCTPASMVDVGCGDGKLLAAVRRLSPALPVLGIDGSAMALERAAAAGVTVWAHDLSSTRSSDVAALVQRIAPFDVVVSLETAEHLPPWAGARFAASLAEQARLVVFSAAQPGQGGTLHMNERPPEYWQARFAACGFRRAAADAEFGAAVATLDLPWWYAANVHLFERA